MDAEFSYQWYADGVPITGRSDQQMTLTSSQAGKRISFKVTVVRPGLQPTPVMSLATPRVSTVGAPTVTRTVDWRTMSVSPGSWPAGTTLSYQWLMNGFAIDGATKTTLVVPSDAQYVIISVLVTATRPGYETVAVDANMERKPMLLQRRLNSGAAAELPAAQQNGGMAGYLMNDRGTGPVAGARVRVYAAGSGLDNAPLRLVKTLTSDGDGHVAVADLYPGLYCVWIDPPAGSGLRVVRADCRTGQAGVQVFAGSVTDVSQILDMGGRLTGTVSSSIGSKVAGAVVTVYGHSLGPPGQMTMLAIARTTTGTNGQYTVAGLPTGYYVHFAGPTSLSHRPEWWSQRRTARSANHVTASAGGTATANANLKTYLPIGIPTISGVANIGSPLTATHPINTGAIYTYQWFANGVAIPGATKKKLTLPATVEGKAISVRVVGSRSSFLTTTRTSAVTAKVMRSTSPTITGSVAVGRTLTASVGSWTTGTTFTYQWYRNAVAITGATGRTHQLAVADRDARITVRAQGHKTGYATVTRPSAATTLVAKITYPTITGTAKVGGVLTAVPGEWTPGTVLSYQWNANGAPIAGARSAKLLLSPAHRGATITVKVTGAKAGYTTFALTSATTSKVS
ncbi:carboxypeptidase regulatory-like domain-containing protein [Microbacterium sulfonylureivorans]|uniref:carboxypeptidase regulatory-like domain-containing protein n=1 Tax=Microbacterium sulfonylureivorans TaxID=2486854 RepID=UPI0013E0628F|nr:carboxypeptidase regulatory-like domain-containing protein [Microbacterium sulfonylureivorans]